MLRTDDLRRWGTALRAASKHTLFPRPRVWAAAAAGAVLAWLFVELSGELFFEEEAGASLLAVDRAILEAAATLRRSWLTGAAVDLTALGSVSVLTVLVAVALVVLAGARDRAGALQLAVGGAGAACWVVLLKSLLERDRPLLVSRLVEVTGFSYPSGHTLAAAAIYTTLAIVACRGVAPGWPRGAVLAAAGAIILAVGASRVYLGVHYPSDVLAGLLAGLAWAFALAAARFWLAGRG